VAAAITIAAGSINEKRRIEFAKGTVVIEVFIIAPCLRSEKQPPMVLVFVGIRASQD
jgi:hypothetical protein